MCKISVIVPVYNAEKYLHRCVDSILSQTFTDFELLLINDGSKDGSGAICDEYALKDSRVRVFHKKNGGVSSARNLGLVKAKGEWITFCDSDDFVYSCWLENYNIRGYGANYDIVCQALEIDRPESSTDGITTDSIEFCGCVNEFIDKLYKMDYLGYTTNKIFRSSIINNNSLMFNVDLTYKEDELFVLQYLQRCKYCLFVNKIGYFYFMPQWDNKYKLDFEYERLLHKLLFIQLLKLGINKGSCYFRGVREGFTDVYLREFYKNPLNRRTCLKGIQYILNIDYKHSQLFPITKFFIYVDPTTYISRYVLLLHLKLKLLFNK